MMKPVSGSLFVFALLSLGALSAIPAGAALREFEDEFGRVIEAELVSHKGVDSGAVTIRKADGRELEVKVAVFSERDQAYIREWMGRVPPLVEYAFRVGFTKQHGSSSNSIAYLVEITNTSRDTVRDLTVKSRLMYPSRKLPWGKKYFRYGGGLVGVEESVDVPAALKFNETLSFTTPARRNAEGVLVRVYNSQGEMVAEGRSGSTKLAGVRWEDGKARKQKKKK